ncbi:S24 family peptidase [Capnocytophaga gingivalis]|uniref:S24 family peptidase n=1 Tax=Capnocytophaga gingivalis TaxID=1017 RepID=UPI0028EC82EF|nr:S24 family peptidase [Capnocytophaga gingivalis]
MDKNTINQRFTEAVNFVLSQNKSLKKGDIAGFLKLKPSTFSEILNNRSNVSAEVVANFCTEYNIDIVWLLTGKGEMLKTEKTEEPIVKIVEGRDLVPKVVVVNEENDEAFIPLVEYKAQAGYLTGYLDENYIEKLPMYSVPGLYGGSFRMFQVKGLSMYPTLQDGSYVIGEFVESWEYMTDNRVYIIVTVNEGIIVKRVKNRIRKYKSLYCSSDNREYGNIRIPIEDVKEVWEAKMHLSFEFLDPVTNYQKIADLEVDIHNLKEQIKHLKEEKDTDTPIILDK